jgi:hypothetical protein
MITRSYCCPYSLIVRCFIILFVSDQTSTVATSFSVTDGSLTAANNVVEKPQSPAANVYHGFPVDVERLLKMFPSELSKIKAKDKSRDRILVSCNVNLSTIDSTV